MTAKAMILAGRILTLVSLSCLGFGSPAQEYPNKPIRAIVPTPPGE